MELKIQIFWATINLLKIFTFENMVFQGNDLYSVIHLPTEPSPSTWNLNLAEVNNQTHHILFHNKNPWLYNGSLISNSNPLLCNNTTSTCFWHMQIIAESTIGYLITV